MGTKLNPSAEGQNSKVKTKEEKSPKKPKSTAEKAKTPEKPKKSVSEPQTMEELLAISGITSFSLKRGVTITGTVTSISAKEILVDIGKKSFGIVAEWELDQVRDYVKQLKVGDKVTAQVINPENEYGYTVLSFRRASHETRWERLNEIKETGEDIEVMGLEPAKGGVLVDWQNLRGFIPSTQLTSEFVSNPSQLINRRIKVKVIEIDPAINRLVLSQKASAMGVTPTIQKEKLAKIKQNDVVKGTISGIAPFGIFVDVDGIEGLIHISEVAWEKVDNLAGIYKVGAKIEVMILDVNTNEGKLNLSIKRLTPDPWKNILDRYPMESSVSGKVVRSLPYGIFVQLEPGIEGLLHISKLTPGEEPLVGEKIECMVEKIDTVKRKISLTLVPTAKPVGYR